MVDFLNKLLRAGEGRLLRRLELVAEETTAWEPTIEELDDEALRAKTVEFRERLDEGEELDDILPEAFAWCARPPSARSAAALRRPARRRRGDPRGRDRRDGDRRGQDARRHAAALPQRLEGKGVHVVTVNDYLARRDAEWMRPIYEALGMTVG